MTTARERVEHYSIPEPNSGCWIWLGALSAGKYGSILHNGRMQKAHRIAYEVFVGEIPPGLDLDHLCRNTLCCNPAHMEPVTRSENLKRSPLMARKSNVTHCPRGHPYEGWNLKLSKKGWRRCRTCQIEAMRAWRAKR